MSDVRIGLIGAGRIGQVHGEAIATHVSGARLAMVADVSVESAQSMGEKYNIPATDQYQEILNAPDIDAVLICSSTDTHAQFITEAAQAGKHIFCEKPIDHDLARIDAALAAVDKAGVKLMIGFQRRFDHNFMQLKKMVTDGQVGEPHILRITSRDPAPPPIAYIKVSGGIFFDMTIHDFDMARFLVGEVSEVYTSGAVLVDPAIGEAGDVDTAVISLKFANGAIGTIDNSRKSAYGYDQRVELFGSKGMVQVANDLPSTAVYSHAGGVQAEKPLHFFLERYMGAYAEEMRQFCDCLINDTPPPVTGVDGRAPVVIAMAAQRSYEENRPISLKEIEGG